MLERLFRGVFQWPPARCTLKYVNSCVSTHCRDTQMWPKTMRCRWWRQMVLVVATMVLVVAMDGAGGSYGWRRWSFSGTASAAKQPYTRCSGTGGGTFLPPAPTRGTTCSRQWEHRRHRLAQSAQISAQIRQICGVLSGFSAGGGKIPQKRGFLSEFTAAEVHEGSGGFYHLIPYLRRMGRSCFSMERSQRE